MKRLVLFPALILVLALFASGCEVLGDAFQKDPVGFIQSVGRVGQAAVGASKDITEEQEFYLGRTVSARLLAQYPLLQDAKLHKYVNLVGSSVAMVSDRPDLHYHFAILNSEEVNAFAAPGGFIFITHGMILGMESEEELAAVLAHEVGHVSARHSIASVRGALWKRVAVITAQETARHAGVNPELLDLFGEATDKIVGTLLTVGYDQGQEFEADQLGQEYAARAGYDPAATRRYLERMKQRAAGRDQTLTARLGTHPAFDKRLEKLPAKDAANLNPEAVDFRSKRFMGTIR